MKNEYKKSKIKVYKFSGSVAFQIGNTISKQSEEAIVVELESLLMGHRRTKCIYNSLK